MNNKYDIFISYRREGGEQYARTIQQSLEKQYRVFLDFDELKDGVFDKRIMNAIREAPVFLLILSHGALDRCTDEDDWVRKEILYAGECARHIVPIVIIDDVFEGIPENLPQDLKNLISAHQFSELQMKTLFKASMDELIRYRIAPYVVNDEEKSGVKIHIETDMPCSMFQFSTYMKDLQPNVDNVVMMNPGTYKLSFVSTQFPDIVITQKYTLPLGAFSDFIEINLKNLVNQKIEEENKHKAEEEERKRLEKLILYSFHCDGKSGYKDKTGKVVIPCKWERAYEFHEGLAAVKEIKGKWGFIDKTGKIVIPCKWREANSFNDGLAPVEDPNSHKYGFIDKNGEMIIPCNWSYAESFSEGLARVRIQDKSSFTGGLWGFIDKTGKEIIPCKWSYTDNWFKDGFLKVSEDSMHCGLIDKTGKIIIPCQWKGIGEFKDDYVSVKDNNGKWGFVDKTGNVVIPCKWEGVHSFYEGLADVKDSNGKFGFIDKTGNVVIPCRWDGAGQFYEGLARVKDSNGKIGFIDKTGNLVIPCLWNDYYCSFFREGLASVKDSNGKFGFIDKTGKLVIPCKWEDANAFRNGLAKVKDVSGKYWMIDKTGKAISEG